jgi:hypothetical protein|tara:strand:+ start:504 stop:650 length:147 start_codon:yes stop_codon:yes gene_type:complete
MRIILSALIVFMGVNLLITVLNSQTVNTIKERNAAIEALLKPPSTSIK